MIDTMCSKKTMALLWWPCGHSPTLLFYTTEMPAQCIETLSHYNTCLSKQTSATQMRIHHLYLYEALDTTRSHLHRVASDLSVFAQLHNTAKDTWTRGSDQCKPGLAHYL